MLRAYVRVLDEIHDKTVEQQRRGILVPRAAIPGCIELIDGLRESLDDWLAGTVAGALGAMYLVVHRRLREKLVAPEMGAQRSASKRGLVILRRCRSCTEWPR